MSHSKRRLASLKTVQAVRPSMQSWRFRFSLWGPQDWRTISAKRLCPLDLAYQTDKSMNQDSAQIYIESASPLQVRELLHKRIRDMYLHPQFNTDVMKPLKMDVLLDQEVQNLSGGELQRVAISLALGKPADVYLIDEPSAYLDSEQRIVAAKV